jgi:FkbM family methyltransferase
MKILFVLKQKKNVETFIAAIRTLIDRGHSVALAIQEWSDARDDEYRSDIPSDRFTVVRCPAHRQDQWAEVAWLLRSLRDCAHYQQPALKNAAKLQARTIHKLREELRLNVDNDAAAGVLREVPPQQIRRLEAVFELAERQLPSDPLWDHFLRTQAPDVLLVSPLVHFGAAQADVVTSAKALGIPVGMLLYSWDNLSTKGCLHRSPDRMFVWNEAQRREAKDLHGYPEERVTVVGAPRFDSFFELRPHLTRPDFHEPLGLDPSQPTLLYVCSSQLVSAAELAFVRKWIAAIRAAGPTLRSANLVIRPHPDLALLDSSEPVSEIRWPALRGAKGFASRPFNDPRVIVLRTSDRTQQGFYECIHHSAGVVGLNTSAELEAAIVGRPVYTVLADDDADGQSSTLHFHYLLEGHGGCVRVARDLNEHVGQIEASIVSGVDQAAIRQFVGDFLRPQGLDRPVAPLLADAIERVFGEAHLNDLRASSRELDDTPSLEVSGPHDDHTTPAIVPLEMEKYGYSIRVQVSGTPEGDARPRLDKTTVQWLREHVAIGDVIYDVDAGVGVYAVLAARHHGAVVVAFEPGYAAYSDLCENLRLNGCDGSVLALPFAVADFEGIGELKYPTGMAGQSRHTLRASGWRVKRGSGDDGTFKQSVCATSLDQALQRHELPPPNHLRLGGSASVEGVLAGAARVLQADTLKTIFFTVPAESSDALAARLAPLRWVIARQIPISRGRAHVQLSRADITSQVEGARR